MKDNSEAVRPRRLRENHRDLRHTLIYDAQHADKQQRHQT